MQQNKVEQVVLVVVLQLIQVAQLLVEQQQQIKVTQVVQLLLQPHFKLVVAEVVQEQLEQMDQRLLVQLQVVLVVLVQQVQ